MKKRWILPIITAAALLLCAGCSQAERLRVSVLNVGKADAILITTKDCAVLLDTGKEDTAQSVISALEDRGVTSLDALIISHFDRDHIGGAAQILNNMRVEKIYRPAAEGSGKAYEDFLHALSQSGCEVITVDRRCSFTGAPFSCDILPPDDADDPNASLVTRLYYGNTSFLLPGDASHSQLRTLIDSDIGHFDVLKLPRHGLREENTEEFLDMVSPDYAVITVPGAHFTTRDMLTLLRDKGAQVHETYDGAVEYTSNGKRVEVSIASGR